MRMPFVVLAAVFLSVVAVSGASYINIVEPYNSTLYSNGTLYLGKVGPGQPFYITALSAAVNSSGITVERGWNQMFAIGLPPGWVVSNSSIYSQYLSVKITPYANASTGTYNFTVLARNFGNYSKLGNVIFTAYVNVTPNVFTLGVSPTNITAGPGQPADVTVLINNTGVSDAPFYISVKGLPTAYSNHEVIALHKTSRAFDYPIFENEPGKYTASIYVSSVASPLIHKEANVTLLVQASVPNDYTAIGSGTVAFPIIYEPAYAVMYFIRLLASYV